MSKVLAFACAVLCLCSCRGSVPDRDSPPGADISAVLIGGRMLVANAESRNGATAINLEGDEGRYRLPVYAADTALYRVDAGVYRLSPPRSVVGSVQEEMTVSLEGRTYHLPFPRELMRLRPYEVKPGRILAIGILEATVPPPLPGQPPQIRVRLDESVTARRHLVQNLIKTMMDPRRPESARDNAIAWNRALQISLMQILSEEEQRALYKPAP